MEKIAQAKTRVYLDSAKGSNQALCQIANSVSLNKALQPTAWLNATFKFIAVFKCCGSSKVTALSPASAEGRRYV